MHRLALVIGICAVATATAARAQLLEAVDLPGQDTANVAAFRDLQSPGKYYIAPLRLGIAQPAGTAAFGVQYLKDDQGTPNRETAIFTLSVKLDAPASELEHVKTVLSASGGQPAIAMLPFQHSLSYFVQTASKPLQKTQAAEGNLTAGATLALTFNVTGSKQEIKSLLSGQNAAFGLAMEIVPTLAFGTARAFSFAGDEFLDIVRTVRYLPATAQTDHSNALLEWLHNKMGAWGADEESAARAWLATLIGPADLTVDQSNAPRFGWDLTRTSIESALKGQHPSLRSVTARSDKPRFVAILNFGNLCAAYPDSILNLDTGLPGCNGLD